MKIAILGGSFNPPHIGHYLVAQQVIELAAIDKVWLMPCYNHPFNKKIISAQRRLAMTKVLTTDKIAASDFEIKQKTTSYTSDTLKQLNRAYPQHSFYWIIGSEQLQFLHKWKNYQELINNYNLIIFPRLVAPKNLSEEIKNQLHLQQLPKNIYPLNDPKLIMTNISSSSIRTRIENKQSICYLVPEEIEQYILKNKLYE